MAAVGDVLVKFVADFADFSTNMSKSQRELESWSKSIAQAGQSLEGVLALGKRLVGALAIGESIRQVIAFNVEMQKAGEALAAYSLRTDAAARSQRGLTEESVRLAELIKTTGREWTEDYLARVQKSQDATEDFNNKTFVLGQRLHDLYLQLTQRPGEGGGLIGFASQQANELFDWLEKLVPSVNRAVDVLANGFIIQILATARAIGVLVDATKSLVDWLERTYRAAAVSGSALEEMARAQARARGYNTGPGGGGPATNNPTGAGGGFGLFDQPGVTQSNAEAIRQEQERQRQLARGYGSTLAVPVSLAAGGDNAPATAARGGGGGATDDDTIERQIKRYTALLAAAQKATDTIAAGQGKFIDDLTRQVRVQQQVDDIVAKIVAKGHGIPKPEDIARLTEVVTLEEKRRDENAKQLQYMAAADQLEQKLGDGVKARAIAERDLARIAATNRASPEALSRQAKQNAETLDAQANAAKRYDDNLGSLAAGFENAAAASARAHDLFTTGGQAFDALTGAMGEGIDALVGKSNKGFGEIARDFLLMIAKMTAAAAVSQVFQYLVKAAGLAFGSSIPTPASQGIDVGSVGGVPVGGYRAAGGPVSAGTPYMVGESGPELFVPRAAGNIVPNSQTGGGVTVNIDMNQTQGAANPSQALDFGRKVRAAVVAVIANEKRPGGSLHPATA